MSSGSRSVRDRRAQRGRRDVETRRTRCETFLITSEGERTEPNYFRGLVSARTGRDKIDEIDIRGEGRVTTSLVEETARIVNRSLKSYDNVWVVFDRDDFEDFDEAIATARRLGFHVAWSNESFEYWLCLYLGRYDSGLSRSDWCAILDKRLRAAGKGGYDKNREDIFPVLDEIGSHAKALRYASRIRATYGEGSVPSKCNPCTTVDELVRKLDEELARAGHAD